MEGRAGQGRVPDCLGGLSRVGISSRYNEVSFFAHASICSVNIMSV